MSKEQEPKEYRLLINRKLAEDILFYSLKPALESENEGEVTGFRNRALSMLLGATRKGQGKEFAFITTGDDKQDALSLSKQIADLYPDFKEDFSFPTTNSDHQK